MKSGVIHVIESVGDGTGQVQPDEIEPADVTVTLHQPFGSPDRRGNRPTETCWLDDETVRAHLGVCEPAPASETEYDASIVLAGAPLPDTIDGQEELTIEISVTQIQQAEAATCPGCGEDLRETFEQGGCTACGFYYDGDHLDTQRRAELDRLRDEYEG